MDGLDRLVEIIKVQKSVVIAFERQVRDDQIQAYWAGCLSTLNVILDEIEEIQCTTKKA